MILQVLNSIQFSILSSRFDSIRFLIPNEDGRVVCITGVGLTDKSIYFVVPAEMSCCC